MSRAGTVPEAAVSRVHDEVVHTLTTAGLVTTPVDVTCTPTVRVEVPSVSRRYGLANVLVDGPVVREVYLDSAGRVEHLSGPCRFDRRVLVAIYGVLT